MPVTENKVQFGLKNVHYAPLINGVYGKPVHVEGAVSLGLKPVGDIEKFHAEDMLYFTSPTNDGYEGDLEMANFPMQMLQDIWGHKLDEQSKVLTEYADTPTVPFALLFEVSGDQCKRRCVLYSVTGTRPGIDGKTLAEGKKTPITQKISITASPDARGIVRTCTTAGTPKDVFDNWFNEVFNGKAAAEEGGAAG